MMLTPVSEIAAQKQAALDEAREQRWVALYTKLTGVSDSEARASWMFAAVPPPASDLSIENGETPYDPEQ